MYWSKRLMEDLIERVKVVVGNILEFTDMKDTLL